MAERAGGEDPIAVFQRLLADAQSEPRERVPEPTAFALGTVSEQGRPRVRMLLLKHADAECLAWNLVKETMSVVTQPLLGELRANNLTSNVFRRRRLKSAARTGTAGSAAAR